MPYPNEHAARIRDPRRYVRFRRENDKFGPGIDAIWGVTSQGKVELQAIRFDAKRYTVAQAKAWLKRNNYSPIEFEPASGSAKGSAGTVDLGNLPKYIELCASDGESKVPIDIAAADGEGEIPRFRMLAYTGGLLFANYSFPVVIDMDGFAIPTQTRPIRKDHSASLNLGHTTSIIRQGNNLLVEGVFSGASQVVADVVNAARRGFPWQASVTARPERVVFVEQDRTVEVNGQSFDGPLYVFRKSILGEISVVDLGGDQNTATRLAASFNQFPNPEAYTMDFETWLKAKCGELKLDFDKLTDETKTVLKAQYDAEQKEPPAATLPPPPVKAAAPATPPIPPAVPPVDHDKAAQAAILKAEHRRAAVKKLVGDDDDLTLQALAGEWDDERIKNAVELRDLKAQRPSAPNINLGNHEVDSSKVLEAAICQAGRIPCDKDYPAPVLEAAHKRFGGRISLGELLLLKARDNGWYSPDMRIHTGNGREILRAAFSTRDIEGIIGAVANKSMLAGYSGIEDTWRKIARIRPTQNLQVQTGYRLTGDMQYEEVGKDGKLKHATLSEQEYTNQPKTYGRILQVDRADIINDNLGALTDVPRMLGRGGALKINDVFWTKVFASLATVFPVDDSNGNYYADAAAALSVDSLSVVSAKQDDQTDSEGKPLGTPGKILVVPSALKVAGWQILNSTEVRQTAADAGQAPTRNPHAGNYDLAVSSYMGNASYGASNLHWFLVCDPMDLALLEILFLNGQEQPTVESVSPMPDELGIAMRGYHDFGVEYVDHRAGQYSKGEA